MQGFAGNGDVPYFGGLAGAKGDNQSGDDEREEGVVTHGGMESNKQAVVNPVAVSSLYCSRHGVVKRKKAPPGLKPGGVEKEG